MGMHKRCNSYVYRYKHDDVCVYVSMHVPTERAALPLVCGREQWDTQDELYNSLYHCFLILVFGLLCSVSGEITF